MKRLFSSIFWVAIFALAIHAARAQEEAGIGRVGGVLFVDANGNGEFDEGEELPPDIVITLFRINEEGKRELVATSLSLDENGQFNFGELPPGTYVLGFDFGGGVKVETQSFQITPDNTRISLTLPINAAAVGTYSFVTYSDDDGNQLRYRNPSAILGAEVSNFMP